jgi:hypothetical protein
MSWQYAAFYMGERDWIVGVRCRLATARLDCHAVIFSRRNSYTQDC